MYSDAITFAYNCQPHIPTSLAPFELVLSLPPRPLALEAKPSTSMGTASFKDKFKACLDKTLAETRTELKASQ